MDKIVLEMCYIAPTQDMVFFDKALVGYMMFSLCLFVIVHYGEQWNCNANVIAKNLLCFPLYILTAL